MTYLSMPEIPNNTGSKGGMSSEILHRRLITNTLIISHLYQQI